MDWLQKNYIINQNPHEICDNFFHSLFKIFFVNSNKKVRYKISKDLMGFPV
jgi:hypothetical protein